MTGFDARGFIQFGASSSVTMALIGGWSSATHCHTEGVRASHSKM